MDRQGLSSYTFVEPIGAGSFGEVWKVERLRGSQHPILAAMKISYRAADSQEAVNELRGLRMAASLEPPGFIQIWEITQAMNRLVIVMELAECTFWQLLARNRHRPVIQTVRDFRSIARTIDSLAARRIVHGGLSPAELVLYQGEPRIIDFSLMHDLRGPFPHVDHVNLLTWWCMSPEMRQRTPSVHSDQYSLAASYAMLRLSRLPAVNPCSPTVTLDGLGLHERQVVVQALAENPNDRFPTCSVFTSRLEVAVVLDGSAPSSNAAQAPPSEQ